MQLNNILWSKVHLHRTRTTTELSSWWHILHGATYNNMWKVSVVFIWLFSLLTADILLVHGCFNTPVVQHLNTYSYHSHCHTWEWTHLINKFDICSAPHSFWLVCDSTMLHTCRLTVCECGAYHNLHCLLCSFYLVDICVQKISFMLII